MKLTLVVLVAALLSGCMATFGDAQYQRSDRETAELAYYEAMLAAASQPQAPLFEMIVRPGESITGIERITVNAPSDRTAIAQYTPPRSEWAPVVGNVLSAVAPLAFGMWGTYEITKAATAAVGAVARDPTVVQQPAPTIVEQPAPTIVEQPPPAIVQPPPPEVVQIPGAPPPEVIQIPAPEVIQLPPPQVIQAP